MQPFIANTSRGDLTEITRAIGLLVGEDTVVELRALNVPGGGTVSGYFDGEQIRPCEQACIRAFVPKPLTSSSKAEGRFGKQDFVYIAQDDEYCCPAGQRLINRCKTIENGMTLSVYWSSDCAACLMKAQCTPGKERRVRR